MNPTLFWILVIGTQPPVGLPAFHSKTECESAYAALLTTDDAPKPEHYCIPPPSPPSDDDEGDSGRP